MEHYLYWLASSPVATAVKVGVAASLAWVVGNPNALNLPVAASVGLTAALPVLINWLNPADGRYGKGDETYAH